MSALGDVIRNDDTYSCGCCATYDYEKYEDRAEAEAAVVGAFIVSRLEQLRAGLITAPEQRVADEAITEVKRLLEEQ